jgi:hypothetical protein
MTTGQTNIWRAHVRQATLAALRERRPLSAINPRAVFFHTIRQGVTRATFIAKVEGDEFSRYPRR